MQAVVTVVAALAAGLGFDRFRVPGGALVGALIGSAAVTLLWTSPGEPPAAVGAVLTASVGLLMGAMVTRERIVALAPLAGPALLSAAGLIVAGLGIAALLEVTGFAPPAAVFATSPGALSVLIAAASEAGRGEVQVALFHVVRLVLVILTVPIITRWLPARD